MTLLAVIATDVDDLNANPEADGTKSADRNEATTSIAGIADGLLLPMVILECMLSVCM